MALFDAKSKAIATYQKSIEDNEKVIGTYYDQIGKLYYAQYMDINVDVTKEINQRCDNITALKASIEDLEIRILYEKGLKRCPDCRTENGLNYDFCFKCGRKFAKDEEPAPVAEETVAPEVAEAPATEAPAEAEN